MSWDDRSQRASYKFTVPATTGQDMSGEPRIPPSQTTTKRRHPHMVRRRRVIKSCVNCQRRKVKCDKLTPSCTNCQKVDLDCQYYDATAADENITQSDDGNITSVQSVRSLSSTSTLAEPKLEKAPAAAGDLGSISASGSTTVNNNTVDISLNVSITNSSVGVSSSNRRLTRRINTESSGTDDSSERPVDAGYLAIDPVTGASRYANGVFWGAYFKELADVSSILSSRSKAFNLDVIAQDESATAMMISYYSSSPSDAVAVLLTLLPEKSISDDLVERYFAAVHQSIPLLNKCWFRKAYDSFWMNARTQSDVDTLFLPLLFVVYFTATLSICETVLFDIFRSPNEHITAVEAMERQNLQEQKITEQRAQQNKYRIAVEISLAACRFPSQPSLQGLLASTLLYSCNAAHSSDAGTGTVARLIRVAQMMGMHRDPLNFKVQMDVELAQTRRLVWWQLIQLDYIISMSQGLPPVVHSMESDVKLPSEHVIVDGHEYEDQDDAAVMAMNAVSEAAMLNCTILLSVYGIQKCTTAQINKLDEEIVKIRPKMERRWRRIVEMRYANPDSPDTLFNEWVFYFIHLVNEKSYTYLHHPHDLVDSHAAAGQAASNEPTLREKVVRSATNTLYYYLGFTRMPDFLPFVWYFRTIQPYHAIIILLQDLYINPPVLPKPAAANIEDERLRVIEQTFQVMHFLKIMDTSEAVRNMWQMLNKLRTGTFLKIGYNNPIGLPLVSSKLAPEYMNLVGQAPRGTTMNMSMVVSQDYGAKSASALQEDLNIPLDYVSGFQFSPPPTHSASFSNFSASLTLPNGGTLMSHISSPYSSLSPIPRPTGVDVTTANTFTSNVEALPEGAGLPAVETANVTELPRTEQYDDFFNFAAQMENVEGWDNKWDSLLRGNPGN
ncbi:uncharacterized protein V1518DRAFT_410119 [Limtongia smithiae]|uniref:uncharacterized protein n=1 Tax=Limtongia smithiae TaxID=1125753 RepID=UPI0034CD51B0